jgi:hypothetical protein
VAGKRKQKKVVFGVFSTIVAYAPVTLICPRISTRVESEVGGHSP